MAFDFQSAPTVGQVYPASGFQQYQWDGEKWTIPGGLPASFPDAPSDGALYGRQSAAWAKAVKLAGDTMTGALKISGPNFTNGVQFNNTTTGKQETIRASSAAGGGLEVINNAFSGAILTLDDTGNFGVGGTITANAGISGASFTTNGSLTVNSPGQGIFNNGLIAYNAAGTIAQATGFNTMVQGAGGGNEVAITFHRPGAFAVNMGVNASNRFGYGGWSAGAAFYQFWSTQDCGFPVSNGRLAMAADYLHGNAAALVEPYGGAVITGSGGVDSTNSMYYSRFRYLQLFTSAWFTVAYA